MTLINVEITMILKKIDNASRSHMRIIAVALIMALLPFISVSASYAQGSSSSSILPSITSLIFDDADEDDPVIVCSNPLLPAYQIGLLFPGSSSITVTSGPLDNSSLPGTNEINDAQMLAFLKAACFWQNVIVGDISQSPQLTTVCGRNVFNGLPFIIDDLLIIVEIGIVDGPGGTVSTSGPCLFDEGFPKAGVMTFDSEDLAVFETLGTLDAVVRHEMGHVLGIGTMWKPLNLIVDELPENLPNLLLSQPKYIGQKGVAEFNALGGIGDFVPIENGFVDGTPNGAGPTAVNGHLAESALGAEELMTFKIVSVDPPLSRVTIATLEDIGYTVDYSQADDLPLP